ncbi:MAG: glycosyltransferase [Candidatus Bathyarchaeia archaeon]
MRTINDPKALGDPKEVVLIIPDPPLEGIAGFQLLKLLNEMGYKVHLMNTYRGGTGIRSLVENHIRGLWLLRHSGKKVICRDGYRVFLIVTLMKALGSDILQWWGIDPLAVAGARSKIFPFFVRYMTKWLCKIGDVLVNIDPLSERSVREVCGKRQRILLEPLDLAPFINARTERKGDYFLFPARVAREKRVHILLEAARKYGLNVVMTGDIQDKKYWREISYMVDGERIKHIGKLGIEELAKVMASAKATVIPSYAEGVSSSAIQSLTAGTSVVIPRAGGYEFLQSVCSGVFTFEPEGLTPDTLYDLMIQASEVIPTCDIARFDGRRAWMELLSEFIEGHQ